MKKQITIFGTNDIGLAAVADLTLRDFEVSLYCPDPEDERVQTMQKENGIYFNGEWVSFSRFIFDVEEALSASSLVLMTESANSIEQLAEICAPYLMENHRIVFLGHGSLASTRWTQRLKELGCEVEVSVGETHAPPYEAVFDEKSGEVTMTLRSKQLLFSTGGTEDQEEFFREFRRFYPSLVKASSTWEVLLNNLLPETVLVPLLANLTILDRENEPFALYSDGISVSVVNIMQEVDEERQKICRALGFDAKSIERRLVETGHAKPLGELIDQLRESDVFKEKSNVRNHLVDQLVEGLHFGLVPWIDLAKLLELDTPTMNALLQLASVSMDRLLLQEGLTLDKVGVFDEKALALDPTIQENDEETNESLSNEILHN